MKKNSLAIIAPSNTMKSLNLALRQYGEKQLASLEFHVSYGEHVDDQFLSMAGTAKDRLFDLELALRNPEIDGVMAVYGGYNANQVLPNIQYDLLTQKKFFIGYSDITALNIALSHKTDIDCYHGPGFASFCDPALFEYTKKNFLNAISGKTFSVNDPGFFADDAWYLKKDYGPRDCHKENSWITYQSGNVTAPITGGNLDTLCALAGTAYFPDCKNKIIFIEDAVGNMGVFHRNMTQLAQIGIFDHIIGLVIGKFPTQSTLNNHELLSALLKDILGKKKFPVICHVHCSHVDPMLTIPLEKNCTLMAQKDPYIIFNV